MEKSSVRLGIVGLGNMGSAHCRSILEGKAPGAELAAVYDTNKDRADLFPEIPFFEDLRQLVHGGDLGRIRRINWIVTDWFRPEAYYSSGGWWATWAGEGGGVLFNQCPHNLDLYQWIFGMPSKVRGFCQFNDRGEQHLGIIKNFVGAILRGEELLAPAEEGIHSVELGNAILLSSLLEKTVDLPISSKAYEDQLAALIAGSKFHKLIDSASATAADCSKSSSLLLTARFLKNFKPNPHGSHPNCSAALRIPQTGWQDHL